MNGGLFVDYYWGQVASQMIYFLFNTSAPANLDSNIPFLKRTASLHLKKGWLEYHSWWLKSGIHQLIWSIYHYLQGFIHPRWLFGISSINSSFPFLGWPVCRGYVLLVSGIRELINRSTQRTTAPMRLKHTRACWYTRTCQRKDSLGGEFPSSWETNQKTIYLVVEPTPLEKLWSSKWLHLLPIFGVKIPTSRRPPERTGKFLLPKRPFSNLSFHGDIRVFRPSVCLLLFSSVWHDGLYRVSV